MLIGELRERRNKMMALKNGCVVTSNLSCFELDF